MSMSPPSDWFERALEMERSHNGPIGAGIIAHRFEKYFEERPAARVDT